MNFTRKGVENKQDMLVSRLPRNKKKVQVIVFKLILVMLLLCMIAGVGAGFGMLKGILDDTPEVKAEDLIPKGYQSTLVDQSGKTVVTLSNYDSNREYVEYKDIPKDLVNAFVAIEDKRFWEHNGIDVQGIARAVMIAIKTRDPSQGASTLTQQLIKNQIFNVGLNETTFIEKVERKIQEQYLAIEMEKTLTKEEIVEYYLNTIYLSQSRYGVQTAAEYYFGKKLSGLTVSECAVLAAIPQNPSRYDPVINPDNNAERRVLVLKEMLDLGYITKAQYDEALADNVYDRINSLAERRENKPQKVYSYYTDATINQLEEDLVSMGYAKDTAEADNMIYSGGLTVKICQDSELQDVCDEVLNDSSNYPYDEYKLNYALTLTDTNGDTYNYSENMMQEWYREEQGQSNFDLMFSTPEDAREAANVYKAAMIDQTGYKELAESYKVTVQPQISFTLMDQSTGQVKAIVGGRGDKTESRSFNRASEATRQPGSAFKVVSGFLPALQACGMTLATTFVDEPYSYPDGTPVRNWWGASYRGPQSIRDAIRDSENIVSVKCFEEVTPEVGFEYLQKLGFTTLVDQRTESDGSIVSDKHLSTVLGGLTDGITNLEITAAYATIANGGKYNKPIFYTEVYDHEGNLIIDNRTPENKEVISEENAWLLTDAMHDVVTSGTGTTANPYSGLYAAGKTGTTSNNFDAWFCGITPYYSASIWIGYDVNTQFSAGSYHKIMWRKIMDKIVEVKELDTSKRFEKPEGIVMATVCKESGLLPIEGCQTKTEYFAKGTVPIKYCTGATDGNRITLCNESHLKATEFCPETTEYRYIVDDETGDITIIGADFQYDNSILTTLCNIHTEENSEDESSDDDKKKFTITTSAGEGGTISPSTTVSEGDSYTVYIQANSGYSIADVYVDGSSVGAVSSYTFSNVTSDHTISAVFSGGGAPTTEEPPAPEPPSSEDTTTETPSTETPTVEPSPEAMSIPESSTEALMRDVYVASTNTKSRTSAAVSVHSFENVFSILNKLIKKN